MTRADRVPLRWTAVALAAATATVGAWAGGDARVRPEPSHVRSVDAPGTPATADVIESWIVMPGGTLRVWGGEAGVEPDPVDTTRAVILTGPGGQLMRVAPGVQPDVGGVPELPADVVVVERDGVKQQIVPGVVDGFQQLAVPAPPMAGLRIVDLPPGAFAPAGAPEPFTLYRVAVEPQTSTEDGTAAGTGDHDGNPD